MDLNRIFMLISVIATGMLFQVETPQTPDFGPLEFAQWQQAGPYEVQASWQEWFDPARNRTVPVKLYYPTQGAGPYPLIVVSHGLGGSRDGLEYLSQHWASHGYVTVHPQHVGSDSSLWQGLKDRRQIMSAMKRAANGRNAMERPRDVSFVIDQMRLLNEADPNLAGRIDMEKIGVAGHSFGAQTALLVSGQTMFGPLGANKSFRDPRVMACIPMSAPVPQLKGRRQQAFSTVSVPALHMTGTLDESMIGKTTPSQRRIPYDLSGSADKYLIVFEGGDHMIFSGRTFKQDRPKDPMFHSLIKASSLAFWDTYLKRNPEAQKYLADQFSRDLAENGTFERQVRE